MRIHLISDLHVDAWERHNDYFLHDLMPDGDETLIIAGDLCEIAYLREHGGEMFRMLCEKYRHVVYVAGNHEYYGTDYPGFQERFKELEGMFGNLHCLEDEVVTLDGVRIAGTTLWFRNTPLNQLYERRLSDFALIQGYRDWVYTRNVEAVTFLQEMQDVDLVVTHHLPCTKSVHASYATEPTNLYFLCDVSDILLDKSPKVAVHGHTHIPCQYELGKTRVFCNPRGYPKENPPGYGPWLIEV